MTKYAKTCNSKERHAHTPTTRLAYMLYTRISLFIFHFTCMITTIRVLN